MTESTALTTVMTPEFFQYGSVGVPVPSCEIKLVDFAEAGYFSTNTRPQGEVWIRGPSVSKGYCASFSLQLLSRKVDASPRSQATRPHRRIDDRRRVDADWGALR